MAIAHKGSWFGLPDFGITEKLTGARTSQGGSNLLGYRAASPGGGNSPSGGGQYVPKTTSSAPPAVASNRGGVLGTSTSSGGGGGGGGGGYVAPQQQYQQPQQTDFSQYQNDQESMLNQQIDQSYNPAFGALDRMEQDYKAQFPTAQAEINQSYASVVPEIQKEQQTELAGITTQRQKGKVENESQVAKARRLASELRQSNLTRFGGSSSTGEAAGELLNRTTAEQFGDINKNFGEYNQNLDKEEANTNNFFAKKLSDLEQEKQLKLRTLQNTFDSKIREINGNRADLESQKAAKRLGALQELSANIQAMKQQESQLTQELNLWKQYKDEAINTARQFNAKSFTVPGFGNKFGGYSITGANTGGGGGGGLGTGVEDMKGIMKNVPEGYELGGYTIGANGKPSYSFEKTKADDEEEDFQF